MQKHIDNFIKIYFADFTAQAEVLRKSQCVMDFHTVTESTGVFSDNCRAFL